MIEAKRPAAEVIKAIEAKGLKIPPNIRQILIAKLPGRRFNSMFDYMSYPDYGFMDYNAFY